MAFQIEQFVFIDFEASSLAIDSWPIEVGLAWIKGEIIQTWASLIRPRPDWDEDAWSDQSAAVHNIPRADLETAPAAVEVAHEMMARLAGKRIVSDAPAFDHRWAARLTEAIDVVPPVFLDFDQVLAGASRGNAEAIWHAFAQLDKISQPHRAGPDAARLAAIVLAAHQGARNQ